MACPDCQTKAGNTTQRKGKIRYRQMRGRHMLCKAARNFKSVRLGLPVRKLECTKNKVGNP